MTDAAETTIGIDVGGTRIRAARIARDGAMAGRIAEAVDPTRGGFAAQVLRLVGALRHPATAAVGIGIPGRVAGGSGEILSAGYLDIAGLDLPALVRDEAGLPAQVENDAMAALIGEAHGAHGLVAMVTVGTGIGGALLCDGKPWHGGGVAGQFGHVTVAADGPPCNCGRTGCVETFSSGTALGRLIAAAGLPATTTVESLLAASATGDPGAADILRDWAAPMQRALETLVAVVDPVRLILGGGLGHAMAGALVRLPDRSPWFSLAPEPARLGDDAGVIGAGLAAFDGARGA